MQGGKILPVFKGKGKRSVSARGRNPAGSCRHKNNVVPAGRGKKGLTYLRRISRKSPWLRWAPGVVSVWSFILPLFPVLLPQPSLSPSPPLIPLSTAVLFTQLFLFSSGLSNSSATEKFFSLGIPAPHALVNCISYYLNNKSFSHPYPCHSELLICSSNDFVSASWDT